MHFTLHPHHGKVRNVVEKIRDNIMGLLRPTLQLDILSPYQSIPSRDGTPALQLSETHE